MEVNIHHAKTNLSQLILKAESGEEVIIARAGKPVVRLVPVHPEVKKRKAGALKHLLKGVDASLLLDVNPQLDEEIAESFNESPLLYTDEMVRQQESGKKSRKRGAHKR